MSFIRKHGRQILTWIITIFSIQIMKSFAEDTTSFYLGIAAIFLSIALCVVTRLIIIPYCKGLFNVK